MADGLMQYLQIINIVDLDAQEPFLISSQDTEFTDLGALTWLFNKIKNPLQNAVCTAHMTF